MGIIYPLHGCIDVFSPPLTTSEDRIDFRYVLPIDLQVQSYFNVFLQEIPEPLGSWDELQMILHNLTKKLPIIVVTYQFDISNSYLLICFIRQCYIFIVLIFYIYTTTCKSCYISYLS